MKSLVQNTAMAYLLECDGESAVKIAISTASRTIGGQQDELDEVRRDILGTSEGHKRRQEQHQHGKETVEGSEEVLGPDEKPQWEYESPGENGQSYFGPLPTRNRAEGQTPKILYNAANWQLLEKATQEAEVILKRVKDYLGVDSQIPLTALQAFAAATPPEFFRALINRINHDGVKVSFKMLVGFLRVELLLRFYRISAEDFRRFRRYHQDTPDRFHHQMFCSEMDSLQDDTSLLQPQNLEANDSNENLLSAMARMQMDSSEHWRKLFFVRNCTWTVLDYDIVPALPNSQKSRVEGSKLKQQHEFDRAHLVTSAASQLILCGNLIPPSSSGDVMASIESVLASLGEGSETSTSDCNSLEPLSHGSEPRAFPVTFIDHSFFDFLRETEPNLTPHVLMKQLASQKIKVIGTIGDTGKAFPFEESDSFPVSATLQENKPVIASHGQAASFQAYDSNSTQSAYLVRLKQHGTRRLYTSLPLFQTNDWVFEANGVHMNSPSIPRLPHQSPMDSLSHTVDSDEERWDRMLAEVRERVYIMASSKGSEDWQLAEKFRATELVTFAIINCLKADFLSDPNLQDLHICAKKAACLHSTVEVGTDSRLVEKVNNNKSTGEEPLHDSIDEATAPQVVSKSTKAAPSYWTDRGSLWTKAKLIDEANRLNIVPADDFDKLTKKQLAVILATYYKDHEDAMSDKESPSTTTEAMGSKKRARSSRAALEQYSERRTRKQARTQTDEELDQGVDITEGSNEQGGVTKPGANNEEFLPDSLQGRQKSFLRHLVPCWFPEKRDIKGDFQSDSFDMGRLVNFLQQCQSYPKYHCHAVHDGGLMIRRDVKFMASSVDKIAILSREVSSDDSPTHFVVPIHVHDVINEKALKSIKASAQKYGAVSETRAEESSFENLISNPQTRTQILHQASLLDVDYSMLMLTAGGTIQQVVLVEVPTSTRLSWLDLLRRLQVEYMNFAYEEDNSPHEERSCPPLVQRSGVLASSPIYGYARDHYTIDQQLQLWLAHQADVIKNGTPPPCQTFLPLIAHAWNKVIGGADETRKSLVISRSYSHLAGKDSHRWIITLGYIIYNAYRIYQLQNVPSHAGPTPHVGNPVSTFDGFLDELHESLNEAGLHHLFPELRKDIDGVVPSIPASVNEAIDSLRVGESEVLDTSSDKAVQTLPGVPVPPEVQNDPGTEVALPGGSTSDEVVAPGGRKYKKILEYNSNSALRQMRLDKSLKHHRLQWTASSKGGTAQRRCILCCKDCRQHKPHKDRNPRVTSFYCSVCKVSLCRKVCFDEFHRLEKLTILPCQGGPAATSKQSAP